MTKRCFHSGGYMIFCEEASLMRGPHLYLRSDQVRLALQTNFKLSKIAENLLKPVGSA